MDSVFQQHPETNYVPSIEEIRDIKNIMQGSLKEVRDIDAKIDKLQRRIQSLQEQRAKVDDHLEQYRASISHAWRLSRNILEEILLLIFQITKITLANECKRGTYAIDTHLQLVEDHCSSYTPATGSSSYRPSQRLSPTTPSIWGLSISFAP